ncbi:hypothetical protein C1886_04560 [Pseudomonas sp. FW300-N1A1]|uniref:lysozyme inhibitor LprI family protein n=1 Tax=Pseudomonas sp. FW300-N1A1 TaxID=2075555 RepID=UPI000CD0E9E6|nr:lysozyme inhibitor LprI family protein [Pseudomonas sp. FW300-N1A1]POA21549.1 hypothetical protein C1886_04560 [Pseudomonas sp. FW300-N1A1]
MTKQLKTGIDKQVAEIRSRLQFGHVDSSHYETATRLFNLVEVLQRVQFSGECELFRYFPVASVAILESHFRANISLIVDQGSPYFERGLKLVGEKLKAVDVIPMIHNKAVTVGDLVAYSLPFSSLAHLVGAYDAILGSDLKKMAATAEDPYFARQNSEFRQPLIQDVSLVWRDLAMAFDARHILAHESASQYEVSFEGASAAVESVKSFTEVVDAILWATIWKEKPLTQYEMNVSAYERYKATRLALSNAIRVKRSELEDDSSKSRFRRLHLQWKKWSLEWCNFNADRFWGGSIRPMILADSLQESAKNRLKEIEDMTGY